MSTGDGGGGTHDHRSAEFDLAVIGAGSAGFAAAIHASGLGARVALIEGGVLGGTCVNVGCVPSKTLLRAAHAHHQRTYHGFDGVATATELPDWCAIKSAKDELVSHLRTAKYESVLRAHHGIELIDQHGRLEREGVRLADGRLLTAAQIIIASGATPAAPAIPGLHSVAYLDSTSAMALEAIPESLVVIGGSAVGLELAQMFFRLGVEVTILEAQPTLLPSESAAVGRALADYLRSEGISVHTGVRIGRVESVADGARVVFTEGSVEHAVTGSQLLVATGRNPNTAGLNLVAAGVKLGSRGAVVVDEFLRTSRPDVFAAGDVTGGPMFVYVAAHAGTLAAENALRGPQRRLDLSALPRVTFTDPAVASVGQSAADAESAGINVAISTLSLEHVPRALAARDTRGFISLVANADTRRIIGSQILAADAGEMIMEPALAIRFGLTIDDLVATFHPYLTLSEGIKLAAQTFDRDVATLSCCAG